MKNLSLVLAGILLLGSVSFAQTAPTSTPAKAPATKEKKVAKKEKKVAKKEKKVAKDEKAAK